MDREHHGPPSEAPPAYDQHHEFQQIPTAPVFQQMPIQPQNLSCPPGLEYLTRLDQLTIKQKTDKFAMFTGANKYTFHNSMGQRCFLGNKKSDGLRRQVSGSRRFDMDVTDNSGRAVLVFRKDRVGSNSHCEMRVKSPITGQLLGVIREKFAFMKRVFEVLDSNGNVILKIKGSLKRYSRLSFKITRPHGQTIGDISRKWDSFSLADKFGITFPMDLDPKIKATLLGAVVLLDCKCSESNSSRH